MKPELTEKILALIEGQSEDQPTAMEFEMAYQARVAIDRVRFAIKHIEQFGPHTDQMRDAGFQLLDALQRLESTDRHFQARSRMGREHFDGKQAGRRNVLDEQQTRPSYPANGHDGRR
jgi:hypothetical protein